MNDHSSLHWASWACSGSWEKKNLFGVVSVRYEQIGKKHDFLNVFVCPHTQTRDERGGKTVSIVAEPAAQHNATTTTIICLLLLLLDSCCYCRCCCCCLCIYEFIEPVRLLVSLLCFAYTTFHYTHHTVRLPMIYSIVECFIVIWFQLQFVCTLALLQYALCALIFLLCILLQTDFPLEFCHFCNEFRVKNWRIFFLFIFCSENHKPSNWIKVEKLLCECSFKRRKYIVIPKNCWNIKLESDFWLPIEF